MMNTLSPQKLAGEKLRKLINENYSSQEEFALHFGAELRTVSRYLNLGINKLSVIQELAEHFNVEIVYFFHN